MSQSVHLLLLIVVPLLLILFNAFIYISSPRNPEVTAERTRDVYLALSYSSIEYKTLFVFLAAIAFGAAVAGLGTHLPIHLVASWLAPLISVFLILALIIMPQFLLQRGLEIVPPRASRIAVQVFCYVLSVALVGSSFIYFGFNYKTIDPVSAILALSTICLSLITSIVTYWHFKTKPPYKEGFETTEKLAELAKSRSAFSHWKPLVIGAALAGGVGFAFVFGKATLDHASSVDSLSTEITVATLFSLPLVFFALINGRVPHNEIWLQDSKVSKVLTVSRLSVRAQQNAVLYSLAVILIGFVATGVARTQMIQSHQVSQSIEALSAAIIGGVMFGLLYRGFFSLAPRSIRNGLLSGFFGGAIALFLFGIRAEVATDGAWLEITLLIGLLSAIVVSIVYSQRFVEFLSDESLVPWRKFRLFLVRLGYCFSLDQFVQTFQQHEERFKSILGVSSAEHLLNLLIKEELIARDILTTSRDYKKTARGLKLSLEPPAKEEQ